MKKVDWVAWGWRVLPVGVVVVIGGVTDWLGRGWAGVRWQSYILLTVGWVAGWLVADLDKYLAGRAGAARLLTDWRRATRNVLTAIVLGVVGVWAASSAESPLARGLVFGLSVRLFMEWVTSGDWRSWFWVFAREFSERERRIFLGIWGGILLLEWLTLVRG